MLTFENRSILFKPIGCIPNVFDTQTNFVHFFFLKESIPFMLITLRFKYSIPNCEKKDIRTFVFRKTIVESIACTCDSV